MTLLDLHFQIIPKREDHYNAVTNLGGLLLLILKNDPRQKTKQKITLHLEHLLKI